MSYFQCHQGAEVGGDLGGVEAAAEEEVAEKEAVGDIPLILPSKHPLMKKLDSRVSMILVGHEILLLSVFAKTIMCSI